MLFESAPEVKESGVHRFGGRLSEGRTDPVYIVRPLGEKPRLPGAKPILGSQLDTVVLEVGKVRKRGQRDLRVGFDGSLVSLPNKPVRARRSDTKFIRRGGIGGPACYTENVTVDDFKIEVSLVDPERLVLGIQVAMAEQAFLVIGGSALEKVSRIVRKDMSHLLSDQADGSVDSFRGTYNQLIAAVIAEDGNGVLSGSEFLNFAPIPAQEPAKPGAGGVSSGIPRSILRSLRQLSLF